MMGGEYGYGLETAMSVLIKLGDRYGADRMIDIDNVHVGASTYANEMFLTGTVAEIVPVVQVDGRTIGSGEVGKRPIEILQLYEDYVRARCFSLLTEGRRSEKISVVDMEKAVKIAVSSPSYFGR